MVSFAEIILRKKELRLRKEEMDLELQSKGFINRGGQLEVIPGSKAEFQQRQAQFTSDKQAKFFESLEKENDARKTDEAFVDYVSSGGDVKTIEKMFNERPRVKQLFNKEFGVETISNIDFENDTQMLDNAGIAPKYYSTLENRKKIKGLLLKYHNGSEWQIANVGDLAKNMGTFKRARHAEQEVIKDQIQEVRNVFLDGGEGGGNIAARKQALAERKQEFTETQAGVTTTQKNIAAFESKREELFEIFGGEEEFFKTDFQQSENKKKGSTLVTAMDNLVDVKFSEAENKIIRNVTANNPLLNASTKLDVSTTGKLKDAIIKSKEFFNIDSLGLEEVQARAAFAMMTSLKRSDMYGATQSPEEMKKFDEAYGKLGDSANTILAKMQLMVRQEKEKVKAVFDSKDPALVHYKSGGLIQKLDRFDDILGQRLLAEDVSNLKNLPLSRSKILRARQRAFSLLNKYREKAELNRQPYASEWDRVFKAESKRLGVTKWLGRTRNPYKDNIKPKPSNVKPKKVNRQQLIDKLKSKLSNKLKTDSKGSVR